MIFVDIFNFPNQIRFIFELVILQRSNFLVPEHYRVNVPVANPAVMVTNSIELPPAELLSELVVMSNNFREQERFISILIARSLIDLFIISKPFIVFPKLAKDF